MIWLGKMTENMEMNVFGVGMCFEHDLSLNSTTKMSKHVLDKLIYCTS